MKWLSRSVTAMIVAGLVFFAELRQIRFEKANFPVGIIAMLLLMVGALIGLGAALSLKRFGRKKLTVIGTVALGIVLLGSVLAALSLILPHS